MHLRAELREIDCDDRRDPTVVPCGGRRRRRSAAAAFGRSIMVYRLTILPVIARTGHLVTKPMASCWTKLPLSVRFV